MKKIILAMIMIWIFVFLLPAAANDEGCTVIAVGKKASADGSLILSHTDAGPDSRIFVVPAARHKAGETAPVYWGIQDARPAAARRRRDPGLYSRKLPRPTLTSTRPIRT